MSLFGCTFVKFLLISFRLSLRNKFKRSAKSVKKAVVTEKKYAYLLRSLFFEPDGAPNQYTRFNYR